MKIITFVFKSLWWVVSGIFKLLFSIFRKKPKYILYENSFLEQNNIEHEIFTDEDLILSIKTYEPNILSLEVEENGEIICEMNYNENLMQDKEIQGVKFDNITALIDNINSWTKIGQLKKENAGANDVYIKPNTFCIIEVL